MAFLSMLLFYFIIILFLVYTFKNNKPLRWNKVMNKLTFNTRQDDDTFRIPGPVRIPIFGTKWNSWFTKMNKLHENYADLNLQYGDVVMEMMGNVPIISLFKRQDIEKVLKFPSKYPFRPPTEIVSFYRKSRPDRYNSVGIVNAQGEEWAHLRMKLTPKTLESRRVLSNARPVLNEISDDFIRSLKERRNNENVVENFDDHLKSMSFESACCLILGRRMGYLDESEMYNVKELASCVKNIFKSFRDAYYGNGLWKYFPSKMYKTFVYNEERVYDIVLDIVNKTIQDEKIKQTDSENASILLTILRTDGLDTRDKISGVIDFLSAGVELISHTVCFVLHYLTIYPEAQEKIYLETANMSESLTKEEMSKAFYTRACIQESARLSPAAFAIARILEEDTCVSGYDLKAGSIVLCQNMIACAKNENFVDATEYKPERWINEKGEFDLDQCVGSPIVQPFGCGKRICPGKKFSEMEVMTLVIKLVREFKFEYHSEFDRQFEFILAPKGPIHIKFVDRS